MSPVEPRSGAQCQKALAEMQSIAALDILQFAIYVAANNRYSSFERRGRLRFGVLNLRSNPDWIGKPEIYFCFIERGGTFFFTHAQERPYEENEKKARAIVAKSLG